MEQRLSLRCRGTCLLLAAALATSAGLATGSSPASAEDDQDVSDVSTTALAEKTAVPTLTKQVGEVTADGTVYGAHADVGTARTVPYRLVGTLPDDYADRSAFRYEFKDVLDSNTMLGDDLTAYAIHDGKKVELPVNVKFLDSATLRVSWDNLKETAPDLAFGDEVVVEYDAYIFQDTVDTGQNKPITNCATLSYSTDDAGTSMETTQVASVDAYTYQLDIRKSDDSGKTSLGNAKFQLTDDEGRIITTTGRYKSYYDESSASSDDDKSQISPSNEIEVIGDETASSADDGMALFSNLDAGTYTLTEIEAPDGYEKLSEPITLKITSNVTEMDDRLTLSAEASEGAEVTSVDAATGRIEVLVRDQKEGAGTAAAATGKSSAGTKGSSSSSAGTAGTSAAGSAYHKTGNPFIDYWWAFVAATVAGIALIRHGIKARRHGRLASAALLEATDYPYPEEQEPSHDRN